MQFAITIYNGLVFGKFRELISMRFGLLVLCVLVGIAFWIGWINCEFNSPLEIFIIIIIELIILRSVMVSIIGCIFETYWCFKFGLHCRHYKLVFCRRWLWHVLLFERVDTFHSQWTTFVGCSVSRVVLSPLFVFCNTVRAFVYMFLRTCICCMILMAISTNFGVGAIFGKVAKALTLIAA